MNILVPCLTSAAKFAFIRFEWLFFFFFFNLMTALCSMWDLNSPTRDQNPSPLFWKHSVLTSREVPSLFFEGSNCQVQQPPLYISEVL